MCAALALDARRPPSPSSPSPAPSRSPSLHTRPLAFRFPEQERGRPRSSKCAALALTARPDCAPSPSPTSPSPPPSRSRSPSLSARPPRLPCSRARVRELHPILLSHCDAANSNRKSPPMKHRSPFRIIFHWLPNLPPPQGGNPSHDTRRRQGQPIGQPYLRSIARAVDSRLALRIRYTVSDGPRGHCTYPSVARVGHISQQFHRTSSRSTKHSIDSRSP